MTLREGMMPHEGVVLYQGMILHEGTMLRDGRIICERMMLHDEIRGCLAVVGIHFARQI